MFETGDLAFVLAESPNGNLLKINKINSYDFSGQVFHDQQYRKCTLDIRKHQPEIAVFMNGQTLGVITLKNDINQVKQLGLIKQEQRTSCPATLRSNFTTTIATVDPTTIQYPQQWTKEFQYEQKLVENQQQLMIDTSAPMLEKIKERPTFLFSTLEDKVLGLTGMAVDNHKVDTVCKWLESNNVAFSQVSPDDVQNETRKGLAVFQLVNSSIPPKTLEKMTNKFGAVIESPNEYLQKVNSLPTRPRDLLPPQQITSTTFQQQPSVNQQTSKLSPQQTTTFQQQPIVNQTLTPTPIPIQQNNTAPNQFTQTQPVTIDNLKNWYTVADKLGKPDKYKQRIAQIANQFKSGQQLTDQALNAMSQDTQQYESINRITKIAQRVGSVMGQPAPDGSIHAQGKVYDISFNANQKNLTIADKKGEVVLQVQSGNIKINQVSPEIVTFFEQANNKVDEYIKKHQTAAIER